MTEIPIRKMAFEFPEIDVDAVIGGGGMEAALLAFSLSLPHLEPYLIRTMTAAKPHVTDPALVEDLRRFSAQEGQHFRAHRRFNDSVRLGGDFPGLARLEEQLGNDYDRFTRTRSLRFNLAYAEGFEAMTCSMAIARLEAGADAAMSPLDALFRWHLVE